MTALECSRIDAFQFSSFEETLQIGSVFQKFIGAHQRGDFLVTALAASVSDHRTRCHRTVDITVLAEMVVAGK